MTILFWALYVVGIFVTHESLYRRFGGRSDKADRSLIGLLSIAWPLLFPVAVFHFVPLAISKLSSFLFGKLR